jgi:hypothetical protein
MLCTPKSMRAAGNACSWRSCRLQQAYKVQPAVQCHRPQAVVTGPAPLQPSIALHTASMMASIFIVETTVLLYIQGSPGRQAGSSMQCKSNLD